MTAFKAGEQMDKLHHVYIAGEYEKQYRCSGKLRATS